MQTARKNVCVVTHGRGYVSAGYGLGEANSFTTSRRAIVAVFGAPTIPSGGIKPIKTSKRRFT